VHHFAVKALRVCKQFCEQLDVDALTKLLSQPYEVTAELGFLLARDHYNSAQLNSKLILAIANCVLLEARTQAYRWIEQQREYFFEQKTRILRKNRQQEVTGIVVNSHPNISQKELKRFRATLYQIEKDGLEGKHWGNSSDVMTSIQGFANFVAMVNPVKGAEFQAQIRRIREKYRRY